MKVWQTCMVGMQSEGEGEEDLLQIVINRMGFMIQFITKSK